jgi:acetoin utilization protein AcuC
LYIGSDVYRRAAFGSHHPLKIMRHSAVLDLVTIMGWLPPESFRDTTPATVDELLGFHDRNYVDALQYAESEGRVSTAARERFQIGTMENPVFDGLFERASMTVGGSIQAAKLALEGHTVFHPSGGTHHGRPDRASGFCYFNDPVFAIRTLLDEGLRRVMYIDLDAHHGDGVEDAFSRDRRVLTLSIHEAGRWPYSGDESHESAVNLPVPRAINDTEFEFLVDGVVVPRIESFDPQAIVICCGADCLAGDPLSAMMLSNVVLWETVEKILAFDRPTVVLGGGGYNPWTVTRYWAGLWGRIDGREIPTELPQEARELLGTMECDLIDEEDICPEWLTTMADNRNRGPVRDDIRSLADKALLGPGCAQNASSSLRGGAADEAIYLKPGI